MSPYHHGNLRNTLIDAGIELINSEGEKAFSLRRVCTLCGVSQAAPYSHFSSKEDMLEAMKAHVTESFTKALSEAAASVDDQDDPRVLIEIGKRYVLFFLQKPEYFTFLFSQARFEVNLSFDADCENNFPPFELMKGHMLRIFASVPKERLEDMIIAMWATVHGLASIATMKNVRYDKDWESKIEDIIWNKEV
jgi:AcrR family transcriptional regulator